MEWHTSKDPNSNLRQHVLSDGDICIAIIHEEWNNHRLEYVTGSATFPNLTTARSLPKREGSLPLRNTLPMSIMSIPCSYRNILFWADIVVIRPVSEPYYFELSDPEIKAKLYNRLKELGVKDE